jgi:uncharacterized protein (TIGR02246 family)
MVVSQEALANLATAYSAAWSSQDPVAVASFYAEDGQIQINRGDILKGRSAIEEMVAGFYAEFPDLVVKCDLCRAGGDHAIFIWTLEGHHAETKHFVRVGGWEEWDLTEDGKVAASKGWFDAAEYDRQVANGL